MICLRCGYCCIIHNVVIVKPEVFKERQFKRLSQLTISDFIVKGMGECPYLSWDSKEASCQIHDEPWYKETPCFSHGQIETSPMDLCRIGDHLRKKGVNVREYCQRAVEAHKLLMKERKK